MRSFTSLALFSAFTLSFAFSHDPLPRQHSHHKKRIHDTPHQSTFTSIRNRAAPVLPDGWQSAGCYAEPGGGRALAVRADFPDPDPSMTQDKCVAYCDTHGFQYAGLEYARECWCGKELASTFSLPDSECNMSCTGDNSQKCGDSFKLNLFKKASPPASPSTFVDLGCYTDQEPRTLDGYRFDLSNGMTRELCSSTCASKGYSYAGVEYQWECFCGSTLSSSAKNLDSSECSMACSGDKSQTCGGSWRVNILGLSGTPTTTPTPTSSPTSTSTSGSTPSASASAYLGCYRDQESRILGERVFPDGGLTNSNCFSTCKSKGFTYSGTEMESECWCGNNLPASAKVAESDCNTSCSGKSSEICGGAWRLSVHGPSDSAPTQPDVPQPDDDYKAVGCFPDDWTRTLPIVGNADGSGQTIQKCLDICRSKSLPYAGIETGSECWCGENILQGRTKLSSDATCNVPCAGKPSEMCGGVWRLNVYHNPKFDRVEDPPTSPSTGDWWTPNGSNTSGKLVVAHVIVGNCYSFTSETWENEMKMAKNQGIDAFVLNLGNDGYIATQTAKAYAAASVVGFKLFFSFDVTAMGCKTEQHANNMRNYLSTYNNHPAQLKDGQGRAYVSTFSGEDCTFGRSSVDEGWRYAVQDGFNTNFLPGFFGDAYEFNKRFPSRNGLFYWDGGFPFGNYDVNFDEDSYRLQFNEGRVYMTGVSPVFFAHYGPDSWNKNWIYRGDNHVYDTRWERLFRERSRVDIVQIVTWNDYGESTYVGPIGVDQPNSEAWVNGFEHTAYLAMTGFWASAFKTGSMPTITNDKVFIVARPHSKDAVAQNDSTGKPRNWEWTEDNVYVSLYSKGDGELTVSTDAGSKTFNVKYGVNKVKAPLGGNISAKLVRNGNTVFNFAPSGFQYQTNPKTYNFNYFSAHGP